MGDFETACLFGQGSGVSPFLPAEQFALHQPRGQGSAVHGHHGAAFAVARTVNRPGNQFLAGSGFPGDQHRGICPAYLFHLGQHLPNAFALPDDFAVAADRLDLLLQVGALQLQAVFQLLDILIGLLQFLVGVLAGSALAKCSCECS